MGGLAIHLPFPSWALEGSNLRPSPCKGDALPAELSARALGACRVAAGATHDLAEHRRQARPSADLAPVQPCGPVEPVALALGAHQRLPPAGHRPHPRRPSLLGIVRGTAAERTSRPVARRRRSVQRPHGLPGYAPVPTGGPEREGRNPRERHRMAPCTRMGAANARRRRRSGRPERVARSASSFVGGPPGPRRS